MEFVPVSDLFLGIFLLVFGGLIRTAAGVLWGSQDMEFWKSYVDFSFKASPLYIYGESDKEIIARYKSGQKFAEVAEAARTKISFAAQYDQRPFYFYPHLPLFLYTILVSGYLYRYFNPVFINNRVLNFFMNLVPTLFVLGTTVLLYALVSDFYGSQYGILVASLYLFSPLVFLSSPCQGFVDVITAFYSTAAIILLYWECPLLGYVFWALSILHKPQGILILPVFFAYAFSNFTVNENLWGILAGITTGVIAALPYILKGRFLGLIHGFLSLGSFSKSLSSQCLNIWWPIQYRYNALRELSHGFQPAEKVFSGGVGTNWFGEYPAELAKSEHGLPASKIGAVLLSLFTVANVYMVVTTEALNAPSFFMAFAIQIYAYYMFRTGVQINHYFGMIPLLTLAAAFETSLMVYYGLIIVVFMCQDFIFYGLGRDFNPAVEFLSRKSLGWLSLILAVANIFLFIAVSCWYFRIL